MSHYDYILGDFRRLFEQDETRFDADEFIHYVEAHDYTTDYGHLKTGFISKKLAEEQFAYQEEKEAEEAAKQTAEERAERARQLGAEAKKRARREYPYSDESFEEAWPQIRAALAAAEMAAQRTKVADPRSYLNGDGSGSFGPVESR